jgi:hypothetical protein
MANTFQRVADNRQGETQEAVEEYMRMAGRMLYEIILEWHKRQEVKNQTQQAIAERKERRAS